MNTGSKRPGSPGILCAAENGGGAARLFRGVRALLVYAALWGALCSMAALSALGLAPLAAGGVLCALLPLLPERPRPERALLAGAGLAVIVLLLARGQDVPDGVKLILNRMFAASEARQAYTYEMFPVSAGQSRPLDCIRYALCPLGLLTGGLCGAASRRGPAAGIVLLAALAGWSAYLGVSPAPLWCAVLAGALVLSLTDMAPEPKTAPWGLGLVLAFALVCAGVLTLFPGEDARLSAWEERSRDALALHTVAHADNWTPQHAGDGGGRREEDPSREEPPAEWELEPLYWSRPMTAGLVILFFALALFLPAVLSDIQRKRRAKNRAGLDAADDRDAVRAMFLYALRWLKLGGLETGNIPHSGYAAQIGTVFAPELRASFEAVLPLWQESAYSAHPMDARQRRQMKEFMEDARRRAWEKLSPRERLLARHYYAL